MSKFQVSRDGPQWLKDADDVVVGLRDKRGVDWMIPMVPSTRAATELLDTPFPALPVAQAAAVGRLVLAEYVGDARFAGAGGRVQSSVFRAPVPAGVDSSGALFRMSFLLEKYYSTATWEVYVAITAPGSNVLNFAVWQAFPASAVLRQEVQVQFAISADRSSAIMGQATPIAGTNYVKDGAAASTVYARDFTGPFDIVLICAVNGDDVGSLRWALAEMESPASGLTQFPSNLIVTAGDSLSASSGATTAAEYPTVLSRLQGGRATVNFGVPGENAAQIATRVVRATSQAGYTHIFQMGRNNVGSPTMVAEVLAALRSCVASLTHSRFLIGSVTPAYSTETVGTANRNLIAATNAAVAAAYPNNYVDTLTPLLSGAEINPAFYASSTPSEVHFNNSGYANIAATYSAAVTARGF